MVATLPNAHFLKLMERGRIPGCSDGERHAYQLARAIRERAVGLDAEAREGLHEWIDFCCAMPSTALDVLHGHYQESPSAEA